jgi:hypothetical protein
VKDTVAHVVNGIVKKSFILIAFEALVPCTSVPPQAEPAPVPEVAIPVPLVIPVVVRPLLVVVAAKGLGPKLLVPPVRPLISQLAKVTVWAEAPMVIIRSRKQRKFLNRLNFINLFLDKRALYLGSKSRVSK